MARFRVLHGPNLNLLGQREPEIYGSATLADIDAALAQQAGAAGHQLDCLQSNAEAELIDAIHALPKLGVRGLVINPGAFTHTSIALRDALLGVAVPFIEVHLSNVHAREAFRQHSYLSDVAVGVITGLGAAGYGYALAALIDRYGED
ncbi:MAG: type II 3-dehydroquinate dehydratase [Pseudomonadota bacterium]